MKLQFVHIEKCTLRASSLYCRWISTRQGEDETLVAIWMDQKMRAFEGEFSHEARIGKQVSGVAKVTGDPPSYIWSDEAGETQNEEARQP